MEIKKLARWRRPGARKDAVVSWQSIRGQFLLLSFFKNLPQTPFVVFGTKQIP